MASYSTRTSFSAPGVLAKECATIVKTGPVSVTHTARCSCGNDCPFYKKGCYVDAGPEYLIDRTLTQQLIDAGRANDLVWIAETEADLIDKLSGFQDLRLHIVGDSKTRRGTWALRDACERFASRRRATKVWTYTHYPHLVRRDDWGGVSVLASTHLPQEVPVHYNAGYATALVVKKFKQRAAYPLPGAPGFKLIPCPAQTTEGVNCMTCRLCMDAERLHKHKLVIGFEAHGSTKNRLPLLPMAED